MNESNLPPVEAAPLPDYKDRSTGLVIFGILTLLLGCLAGLLVPLMLFGQMMAAKAPDAPPVNHAAILPAIGIYGGLAVALIWLGIGSIKTRRWARALLLIFSWSWLIMGVFMTGHAVRHEQVAGEPAARCQNRPAGHAAGNRTAMVIGMTIFFFVAFVLVPAVWVFFYKSRHVKATCEARDPVTRWTDACPLPVFTASRPFLVLAALRRLAALGRLLQIGHPAAERNKLRNIRSSDTLPDPASILATRDWLDPIFSATSCWVSFCFVRRLRMARLTAILSSTIRRSSSFNPRKSAASPNLNPAASAPLA